MNFFSPSFRIVLNTPIKHSCELMKRRFSPLEKGGTYMKRFLFFLGVFLFGFMLLGTINFLTFISVDFDWFRPFIRFMYEPVHPIFNFFNIQDGDDARIIYPIGLSAVVWGVLGGAAGVTSVFFAIRQNDKLQPLKFMGIGTFLFIAGTLLIGNIAQESVIYRY